MKSKLGSDYLDLWQNFTQTGSVNDYLKYKENQKNEELQITNANNNQGLNYQGTNDRRE